MEQSKLESHIESATNISTGFIVSWMLMSFVVPVLWPTVQVGVGSAFWVTALFTVTSYIRMYTWRRFFARGYHRVVHKFARS